MADKLEKRGGPGARPRIGDRVPYIFVAGKKSAKAADLAEDPEWVAERRLKPNYMMYFGHLCSPILDLFSLEAADNQHMFREVLLRSQGQRFITSYFTAS